MMLQMRTVKSSISQNSIEKPLREYQQEGALHSYCATDCLLNGLLIGRRVYNQDGVMVLETPIRDGLKHGREFTWDEDGRLLLVEPYVKGKIHGTAKQYGKQGSVIGTYTLLHGTGLDIWRQEKEDNTIFVSEIHSLREGVPHGYEWHFASPQGDLWHARYWDMGKTHGIERVWNSKGKLRRGYPRFYVLNQVVSKQTYLRLSRDDRTLLAYREDEDLPQRDFPPEIQELLSS
jgi:hypothetical protein